MNIVRNIIGAISALLAIIFIILAIYLCVITGGMPAEATGTVLTEDFITADCVRRALTYQTIMLFLTGFFLTITAVWMLVFKRRDRNTSAISSLLTCVFVLTIMTTCIGGALDPAPDAITVLAYKPVISQGYVTDKYTQEDKDGHSVYILEFNGKSTLTVNSSEYNKALPGKTYYLVYFGSTLLRAYDTLTYSLP